MSERERLRTALLDLCFERGYRAIDLPMLLDRAAVGEPEFRCLYRDLEDCFCAVYVEFHDEFFRRVEAAIVQQDCWRDRIRAAAYAVLRFLQEDPKVTRVSVIEVRFAGERAQRLFQEGIRRLFDLIDEGRSAAGSTESLSRATSEAIGGGILTRIYAAVERGSLDLGEEEIPKLMYAAVLPYLGPEAAAEELRVPPPDESRAEVLSSRT